MMEEHRVRVGDIVRHRDPKRQRCQSRGRVTSLHSTVAITDAGMAHILKASVTWLGRPDDRCVWGASYHRSNLEVIETREDVRAREEAAEMRKIQAAQEAARR